MMILFGIVLYTNSQDHKYSLERKIDALVSSLTLSTKTLVWNFDNASLEKIATQLEESVEVDFVVFSNDKGSPMNKIRSGFENEIDRANNVVTQNILGDKGQVIGSLKLGYNESEIKKSLISSIKQISLIAIIGQLVLSFSVFIFISKISTILVKNIEKLKESSVVSKNNSDSLKSASEELMNSSTDQASAIQETVSTLDQITAMAKTSATNAKESSERAEVCFKVTIKGKEGVVKLSEVIRYLIMNNDQIKLQMIENAKNLEAIIKIITEISVKTNVINDIVSQTKLLSFNASVEAARAGESGKGFAVVAEEVGNLAAMSGKASEEIKKLINLGTENVRSIAKTSNEKVQEIVSEADKQMSSIVEVAKICEDSFDQIVTNMTEVKQMMAQVSVAVDEQSSGVDAISKAMNELDGNVKQNSVSAQQTFINAENLNEQSDEVDKVVMELYQVVNGKES